MPHGNLRPTTLAGLLIPFWLAVGVFTAGLAYPGYSHINQAMSELGAVGAPTHAWSPLLNNYPLGLLFIAFGLAVWRRFPGFLARLSALLIAVHGVASFFTGYFSCDVGCGLESPSSTQQIHNIAGLVMFISLVLASALWIATAPRELGSRRFALFSLLCTVVAVGTLPLMAAAVEAHNGFGLYQRLNYGASVVWTGALAWMMLRRA